MRNHLIHAIQIFFIGIFGVFSALAQETTAQLKGRIVSNDGKAVAAITVKIKHSSLAVQSDENGNFVINGVPVGTHTIRVSGVGIKAIEKVGQINAGQNDWHNIVIAESTAQLKEVAITAYKSINRKAAHLGKVDIPARDLPQAVQVISSEVIQDQQAQRLGDVMKNINGVALGANRGSAGENFYARGYSLGANNVFKNGARTSIGGSPEASTLESVEVLKGSAALLYGGVTGGAVVNMITKKPKFEQGGEVSLRFGSYDEYKPGFDFYGPLSKKIAFRIIGTGETANSFRDNVSSKRLYINPSLLYKINDKSELLVQGDYLKSNYTPDFGLGSVNNQIVDFGREKFLNTPWAFNHTNTASAQINYSNQLSSNWKINAIASYQSYLRNYFGAERIQANTQGISARNVNRINSDEYTYNQQINISGKLKTGKIKHTLLIGLDADQSDVASLSYNYRNTNGQLVSSFNYGNVNVFDPSTYLGSGIMPEAVAISKTTTPVYRHGTFIQDLIELHPKLKLLAGLRYTNQKNAVVHKTTLANGQVSSSPSKWTDAYSPKLGLVYQPLTSSSIYLSYANNFIANTGTDIFLQALPPSIVDQYELGLKNDFLAGRLSANISYYKIINNNIAQMAEFDANGQVNSNSSIKQLNGQTTSDGVEVDVNASVLPGLNFLVGYSYNYMRYTKTAPITSHVVPDPTPSNPSHTKTVVTAGMIEGVRLVGTTANTANATLFYTVQKGAVKGLKMGASAFYTGKRNGGWNDNKAASTIRLIPLTAFTTVDVSAGYTWRHITLLAKVSNITNALNYFVHENYSVNPIAPRQFLTTLSYKF